MLKLRKIQILGFKSFCDRTEVQLSGEGIAAIVGPNGCGKSNISDAITWVLGEQSAKSLRGIKMEDVIFAGTRDRKPTGMAEVSLTLVDPEVYDGSLPHTDGPELVLSDRRQEQTQELIADWDEQQLREQTAAETEEAVAEAQPGTVLEREIPAEGAMASTPAAEGDSSTNDGNVSGEEVVLKIRRRKFNRAPVRAGEITVTRRLFRTGDSEYLLNGRICRLRDIQDIFMGTGLGGESYAIIGQERIGQLLSAKPLDRRSIIEEAAGITRFKTKKRLAELRLESAKQNLSRVNDIFDEVTRQMATLKRQAAKAERYGALRDELRIKLRAVLRSRLSQLDGEHSTANATIAQQTITLDEQAARLDQLEAEHADGVQRGYALDEQLRAEQKQATQAAVELERVAARASANTERIADLSARLASGTSELTAAREQLAQLAGELEQHRAMVESATTETGEAEQVARQQAVAAKDAVAAVQKTEQQVEQARRHALQLMQRAATTRSDIAQAETALAGLDTESERLTRESEVARQELAGLGLQRGQAKLSFESVNERLQRLEAEIAGLRLDTESRRKEESESRRRGDQLRSELASLNGRRNSLESLIRDHSYSTDAVKNIFRVAKKTAQITAEGRAPLGTLADFVEVEGPFGAIVDEFLREELNYVVVGGWEAADDGVRLLRADVSGRVTFLVNADNGPAGIEAGPESPVLQEEGLVPLRDSVRVLNGFSASVYTLLPKLRDGYIAKDAEQALQLSLRHPHAWFLAPTGETFHALTVTAGRAASGGPLAQKRELRELITQVEAAEANLAQSELLTSRLAREIAEASSALERHTQERREAEREAANSGAALRQMDSEAQRIERRLAEWQLASERNRDQRNGRLDLIARRRAEAETADREHATTEASLADLHAQVASLREQREGLQTAAATAAAALAGLEERRRNARSNFDQTNRLLLGQQARLEQLDAQLAAAANERSRREGETTSLADEHTRLTGLRASAEAEGSRLSAEATALRAALAALGTQLRALRAEAEALRDQRAQLSTRAARLASDIAHLESTCLNELGTEPAALREDESVGLLELATLSSHEEETRALKGKLDAMGPVNMMALEEYHETAERHGFLETQRQDLLDSIANTQASIREIDDVSRLKFDEAFKVINENFSLTFAKLFGGGQAMMRLTDEENTAEAGIDLVASPPGKKLQNILLLSGGEKALTALSLLVGIFQFQPAPFCILDEVDAPLDETNVGRFAKLIDDMSSTTQFIVITHSKRTMTQADVIYGVTMQEPGVSKVVSVDLGSRRAKETGRRAVA